MAQLKSRSSNSFLCCHDMPVGLTRARKHALNHLWNPQGDLDRCGDFDNNHPRSLSLLPGHEAHSWLLHFVATPTNLLHSCRPCIGSGTAAITTVIQLLLEFRPWHNNAWTPQIVIQASVIGEAPELRKAPHAKPAGSEHPLLRQIAEGRQGWPVEGSEHPCPQCRSSLQKHPSHPQIQPFSIGFGGRGPGPRLSSEARSRSSNPSGVYCGVY